MAPKEKQEFTPAIRCDHCGNMGPMEIGARHSRSETQTESIEVDEGEYNEYSWDETTTHILLVCQACHRPTLKVEHCDDRMGPDESVTRILYPRPDTMGTVLPTTVRSEYEAAVKVKPINANAYAVLLGRVFDKVCLDRKASGRSLSEKLADLARKGEIPATLVEMAHGLRQLRNVGAHAELGDLTPREIVLLDAILKAILEYVYRAPKLLNEVKRRLAERKGRA